MHYTKSAPARSEHNAHRLQSDKYVQEERAVLEVVEVVRELLFGLSDIRSVVRMPVVAKLCPTGKTGRDEVAGVVVRNTRVVLRGERGQLGARSDEREVASQNVPELRQLVDTQNAEPFSHPRNRQLRFSVLAVVALVVPAHAPEFHDVYRFLEAADALLRDKQRSPVVELYCQIDERIEQKGDDQRRKCDGDI